MVKTIQYIKCLKAIPRTIVVKNHSNIYSDWHKDLATFQSEGEFFSGKIQACRVIRILVYELILC